MRESVAPFFTCQNGHIVLSFYQMDVFSFYRNKFIRSFPFTSFGFYVILGNAFLFQNGVLYTFPLYTLNL